MFVGVWVNDLEKKIGGREEAALYLVFVPGEDGADVHR